MSGELEILGLSPHNDLHIFDTINNSSIEKCTYYFYEESECLYIEELLYKLKEENKIIFKSVIDFWNNL